MTELNTLVFVGIHELSHIASITQGHGDEFWDNLNSYLRMLEAKIYTPKTIAKIVLIIVV